jgi:hypothetical protein
MLKVSGLRSNLVDSRVLRNKRLQTPSGPEGSSGSNPLCVPQGSLAINKLSIEGERTGVGGQLTLMPYIS